MKLSWKRPDTDDPTKNVWQADDPSNAGHHYVCQQSKEGTGQWRLAFREEDTQPLRIIYVSNKLSDCRRYAETFRTTE